MNLESAKKTPFTIALLWLLLAVPAWAQVVVSGFDEVEFKPKRLREVIELELNKYQADAQLLNRKISEELKQLRSEWKSENQALQEFLRIHKKDIERSRIDISAVVRRIRLEFQAIKKENNTTIRASRNNLPPLVFTKGKRNKRRVERISAVQITSYDFLKNVEESNSPVKSNSRKGQKVQTSIEERNNKSSQIQKRKNPGSKGSHASMPLEEQIYQEPLKTHQENLKKLSDRLKTLTVKIKRNPGNTRRYLLDLGNTYLESQRFLNTLDPKDRLTLIRHADVSGTRLGSYGMALWAFKSALILNPKDGNTNLLISDIHQEMGNHSLALERARNAHHIFQQNRSRQKIDQTQSRIESLTLKSETNTRG